MYLKRLQIQGFKTFAAKTEFAFDEGMTAVVGPNGSGKSNVADAIRWVLGEQRYSLLRGRKTEDVIFAGSALKPSMGFAEASITFDNSNGALPLEFSEVTITRRAYRTGENEYFINKSKVRLKDVEEVTSSLSRTYIAITQGMVDAALSQRPEERRGLFEDAAAIGSYNTKKADAEDRLTKTEENSRRLADILAEIGPRLKGLERHAKQAEEYYSLQEDLQKLLSRWYGHRWQSGQAHLQVAEAEEKRAQIALVAAKTELEKMQEGLAEARQRQNEQRGRLAELHHDSSQLHSRAQQLQQQIAVDRERLNGQQRQHESQRQELANLEVTHESTAQRLVELEQEYQNTLTEQASESQNLAEQEGLLKAKTAETQQANLALNQQRESLIRQNNRLETLKMQVVELNQRRAVLTQQIEQYQQNRNTALVRKGELEQEIANFLSSVGTLEAEAAKIAERRQSNEREITATFEAIRQSERQLQDYRSQREAAKSRLDLFKKLQSNFAGLYGGVKSVMQAASGQGKTRLNGILGLVANLLEAPAELELAIETALGGHLQDVVVERWQDAEEAIAFLKASGAGRATFLPLDSLRGGTANLNQSVLQISGVRGVAADLISFDQKYRVVYEQLLSRVLVVDDLKVARRILADLPGGWNAVTLGGEIARSAGAVTGGASSKAGNSAEGSMLMRERELRELPQQISRLERQIQEESSQLANLQSQSSALRQKATELERQNQQTARNQQQTRDRLAALRGQSERLGDELRLREENQQNIVREVVNLDEREKAIVSERQTIEQNQQTSQQVIKQHELALRLAQAAENDERERLAALKTAAAIAGQRLKNSETNLRFARNEIARLEEQITNRQQQLAKLEQQSHNLQTSLETAQHELNQLAERLEQLRVAIVPLETELQQLEHEQLDGERQWGDMSNQLLTLETSHNRAALEVQRIVGELDTIQIQANADLAPSSGGMGGVALDDEDAWQQNAALTNNEANQLQRQIETGRGRVRRIGAVNPLAMQEYKETKERHQFLSTQIKDLDTTAASLRTLIAELDKITQDMFAATFAKVAEHFRHYFGILFNGGTAKLALTSPDNLADTGIEIIAQPPGKRQQNLALLSGGERALTAVALLFALLEVNPTPFCVLDEVDAALDEANVGRFCETLKKLSVKTQFIVITHNRGTIEAARTIYGISMGPESISRVLSLRVDEVAAFKRKSESKNFAAKSKVLNNSKSLV